MTGGIFSRAELTQVSRPAGRIPECGRCGLYKTCKTPKMPVAGQGRKGIMVIGEAPGETEDERGKPFVGKSGEELQAAVRLAGADLFRDCWVTNALSCFIGSQRVKSPSGVIKLYKRKYHGSITVVSTANGRYLAGTPNHPALTPFGWVPLGLLKEGDNLVCHVPAEGLLPSRPDVHHPPPRFEEVFRSFSEFGHVERVVGRGVDFHGDGEDGDVDVVVPHSLLWDRVHPAVQQHCRYPSFVSTHERQVKLFGSRRLLDGPGDLTAVALPPTPGVVSGGGNGLPACDAGAIHPDDHSGTSTAQFHTGPLEHESESVVRRAERVSEWLKSLAGQVSFDRVVKVERKSCDQFFDGDRAADGSCHVYNLETCDGYYLADGIIVSNCRPPGNTIDDPKAIGYCRPLVNAALERYDPRVVLLVGKSPVVSVVEPLFGGIDALSRWVGQRIPHLSTNRWLCPTWHPAYLMREKKDAGWALFREHVRRAVQIKDRPRDYGDSQEDFDASAEACADPEEAARRLDALEHRWGVAFDFETTCLRPESRHADILCCSASDGKVSVAFPWVGKAKETMLQILRDPNVPKIAWNAKFEARWCRRVLGIDVKFAWDGMLGSHLLDPRTGTSGLDFQAFTKLGVANYWRHVAPYMSGNKAKEGANAANSLVRADREELLTYCAKDSLYEHALSTMQMKELRVKWPR